MKRKGTFYLGITLLTVIDSLLLSSPNLLGKIGLFIYKYHYLRTFPRTLLTVAIIIFVAIALAEIISALVRSKLIGRRVGLFILFLLVILSIAVLVKTGLDFSKWTFSHTGQRFKYGAYLLPFILIFIFGYRLINLSRLEQQLPIDSNQTT